MPMITEDSQDAKETMWWIWGYFARQRWRRPPTPLVLDYQTIEATITSFIRAYLKIANPSGRAWPKGAVCPVRLKEYLLIVLPAIIRAQQAPPGVEEIEKIDRAINEYGSVLANNGIPALHVCAEAAYLWHVLLGRE